MLREMIIINSGRISALVELKYTVFESKWPDSEPKQAGKDAESDEEVEKGGEKELPGALQNQNQVREFYFFKLVWRGMVF